VRSTLQDSSAANAVAHQVLQVRHLSPASYVLRFERQGLSFRPGQYIQVGLYGGRDLREYSIYSSPNDPYLEILVRVVEDGFVSRQLQASNPGDLLAVAGPYGEFTIPDDAVGECSFLLVATGTGIAPYRSFLRSYPDLRHTLLHGVRYREDLVGSGEVLLDGYVPCVSRERGGWFHGRVTDYLREYPPAPGTLCYFCGNCDMIYDGFEILMRSGIPRSDLYAEVYF
jgi:ferredoxin--NADP+ reductase/benzoate/toluate 1,2-dioxygenase reductase subunit